MRNETVGLLAFICGGLAALIGIYCPDWWTFPNFIALAGAVATASATWAALWVAGRSDRREKTLAIEMANLTAAGLANNLEQFQSHIDLLYVRLTERVLSMNSPIPEFVEGIQSHIRLKIQEVCTMKIVETDIDLIFRLQALERNAAGRLNGVLAAARTLASETDNLSNEYWLSHRDDLRDRWLDRWQTQIEWMSDQLHIAVPVIVAASKIGAPPLSADNLIVDLED